MNWGLVWFVFFHHSSLKNTLISDNSVCGLFGWNISVSFSIQSLTFMSLTGSHKYHLQIWCTERSPILPAFSLSLSLSFSTPKQSLTSRNPKLTKLSKPVCAKAQHHKSEWCSSSSSRTCLHNTPVPLSIWTWFKDLIAPHFPAFTALDPSLISNSRNPHEGIPNS